MKKEIVIDKYKDIINDKELLEYSLQVGEIFYNIKYEYREDILIYNDYGDLIDSYKIYRPTPKRQIESLEKLLEEIKSGVVYGKEEFITTVEVLNKYKNMCIYNDFIKLEELLGDEIKVKKVFDNDDIFILKSCLKNFNRYKSRDKDVRIHMFCKSMIKDKEYIESVISIYSDYKSKEYMQEYQE